MRFKLTVVALYGILLLALVVSLRPAFADASSWEAIRQEAAQKPSISLDAANGRRGLVHFSHRTHEAVMYRNGFNPPYLNKDAGTMNCVVCHHRRDTADPTRP